MKIMGNNLFDHHHLLKLSAFRKRNGKSMQSISSAPGLGYNNDEMQQAKRLASFVNSIHVTGLGISSGTANKSNEFTINVDTFDYDNLTFDLHQMSSNGLIIVGMAHEMTEVEDYVKICYEVENPGQYIMDIKYLGLHVPASPFKIDVRREWDAKDIKKIIASGKGLKTCTIGEISSVQIESRNLDAEHGRLSVVADGEMDVPLHITESKSGYNIHYLAKAEGVFFLRVKVDGRHIRGSPFMITANKKREIPESAKTFFKRGFLMGGKEKKNDLQP